MDLRAVICGMKGRWGRGEGRFLFIVFFFPPSYSTPGVFAPLGALFGVGLLISIRRGVSGGALFFIPLFLD